MVGKQAHCHGQEQAGDLAPVDKGRHCLRTGPWGAFLPFRLFFSLPMLYRCNLTQREKRGQPSLIARKWHSVCPPQCLLVQVEIAFLISMCMVYSVGRTCFFNHIEMITMQAAG